MIPAFIRGAITVDCFHVGSVILKFPSLKWAGAIAKSLSFFPPNMKGDYRIKRYNSMITDNIFVS
jgi:hypothetical protein